MGSSRRAALPIDKKGQRPHLTAAGARRVADIAVCIATYKRPGMLSALLESLRVQETPPDICRLRAIVVVDNDVDETARSVVDALSEDYPCELIYACVRERNIALARNMGVRKALETGADYFAFTDDDCVASENWLAELASTAQAFHADVVWGRLRAEFEADAPDWIRRSDFFDRPSRPTGTPMPIAESNNVLVRSSLLRPLSEPFDPAFGISGGSDTLLFMRARHTGAKIVWANGAVVTEKVPRYRTRLRWLLQRSYRMGNAGVYNYKAALPVSRWLPARLVKAVGHIGLGFLTLIPAIFSGRMRIVASLRRVALGVGIVTAIAGHRYLEYREVQGE